MKSCYGFKSCFGLHRRCWSLLGEVHGATANLEGLIAAYSTFLKGLLKSALLGGPASASAQTRDLQAGLQAALRSGTQLSTPVGKLQKVVSHQSIKPNCCLMDLLRCLGIVRFL